MSVWSFTRVISCRCNARNVLARNIIRSQSSFDKMVDMRRCQARRSIVVHLESKNIVSGLLSYFEKYGEINHSFIYTLPDNKDFLMLEFSTEDVAKSFLAKIGHRAESTVIPVHTRFLLYHCTATTTAQQSANVAIPKEIKCDNSPTEALLLQSLKSSSSLSDQMQVLYETLQLSEIKKRLCFFTCLQIEETYSGLFPSCQVLPFGSSVNGFGRYSCDLDMIMMLNPQKKPGMDREMHKSLTFLNKHSANNSRTQLQYHLQSMADIVKLFLPGCSNVQRILHARVPIIKFKHELTGFDCDLTIDNPSGYYMSELLYHYGEFDKRVRPLVFTVLMWARRNSLTHENPGHWITNITLTLMVIFFLQVTTPSVLPSLGQLNKLAGKEDSRAFGGLTCKFLRNVLKFPPTQNTQDLGELLRSFFLYYANFNMEKHGMCIVMGCPIMKPDSGSVYMRNPLEMELNVSKNMTSTERKRFSACVENAAWILENPEDVGEDGTLLDRLLNNKFDGSVNQSEKAFQVKSLFTGEINRGPVASYNTSKTTKSKDKSVASSSNNRSNVNKLKRVHLRASKKAPWIW